jgi:hypothetical protein
MGIVKPFRLGICEAFRRGLPNQGACILRPENSYKE